MTSRQTNSRSRADSRSGRVGLLLGFVLVTVPALGQGQSAARLAPATVVARVNGTPINEADLTRELTAAGIAGHARAPKLAAEVRRGVLEELIARELIYQDARKRCVRATPEALERSLEQASKSAGSAVPSAALRREVERRLIVEKATAQEVEARSTVTEAELRALYRQERERLRKPEMVRLRAILASLGPSAKPEEKAAARKKIEKVQAELARGVDFAALAQKYSEDAYRAKGGLIGWVHRGRLDPDIEKVAFALPPGKISAPFETKYGILLLKAEAKRPARQLSYEEAKPGLRAALKHRKAAAALDAWVSELKKHAKIEILNPASS